VSITSCVSAWISSVVSKRQPFNRNFILGNRKKVARGEVRRIAGVGNHCNVFGSQELSNNKMCERARCHGGETNCFSSTCLDLCAKCPPSTSLKSLSKTWHWRFDQGVRIPCGQSLGCQKKRSTRTWHCCELDVLFSTVVNLATSTGTTAT
jgi:hypothetical protein